jgi:hypothetical protein
MSNNCSNYSIDTEWFSGNTIFVQSANAAGRTRVATTSAFVTWLNTNNIVVADIAAGNATGELLITMSDGTQKTISVPA